MEMLKVQTYLDRSAVHGTGLFAKQAIKRGTVVWRLDTRYDRVVSHAEYEAIPEPLQCELFEHHATTYAGLRILYGDDARFLNHSAKPNVMARDPISDMVARRDIDIGEEMFVDYFVISDDAF
jgi:uncharacterized protein